MLSNEGRHWAITSALELEGKITIHPDSVSQINYEYLSEFPIDKILKTLPTKLNSNLIKDDYNGSLNILYTDTDEKFSLTFRNNIMVVSEGLTDDPWDVISLDTETHKMILTKQLSMIDAYNSGDLIFNGNIDDLQWYYDVFDRY